MKFQAECLLWNSFLRTSFPLEASQEKRQMLECLTAHMKSSSVCFHKFSDRQMVMKGREWPSLHIESIFTSLLLVQNNMQNLMIAVVCGVGELHFKYTVMFWT